MTIRRIKKLILGVLVFTLLSMLSGCRGYYDDDGERISVSAASEATASETTPKPTPTVQYRDEELVNVQEIIPSVYVDLRYAGTNNFTGRKIYDFDTAYLRYSTVRKLEKAQELLNECGFSIVIWDAYRPTKAQFRLWEVCPDANYVANPNNGGASSHSRGNTVDISLVTLTGEPVVMPSEFDEFTRKADRDYTEITGEGRINAELLESVMIECGFIPYENEWWHYTDSVSYPVVTEDSAPLAS